MMPLRKYIVLFLTSSLIVSCSTTSGLGEGEQLYAGLEKIEYSNYERNQHFISTQEEIEAALAAAPTGAFFGSSYHRTPFPWRLWLWNATEGKNAGFAKWLNSKFASTPVLMSDVNPILRATVAQNTLASNGYFRGTVDYDELTMKNPKEGKIAYKVNMGHLFTIDSLAYTNFPQEMDSIIVRSRDNSYLKKDDGFSVANLDLERQRLSSLFRNNGYYYYSSGDASYLADTLQSRGKVQLRLQMLDSLDNKVTRKWYIGKTDIYLRKQSNRNLTDSINHRFLTVHYNGKRPPMRPRVILSDTKLRPRALYSENAYKETLNRLTANDNFSSIDIRFTPRDTTSTCDTLDMALDCVFGKPYDISLEGKFTGKTSSRIGPGAELTISRRNLFRYGEKISLNLYGSIEWQTGGSGSGKSVGVHSYEYGGDLTLEIPRLILPGIKHYKLYATPSTIVKGSNQVINRGAYFNRHIMSGELTFTMQPTETSKHIISPLILEYDYMNSMTKEFSNILQENPYLQASMLDQFIPKLRYTYIYTSPSRMKSPISWETTVAESGNVVSLGFMAAGKKWNTQNKQIFKNPYAQFLKVESDFTKKWHVAEHADLVGHVNAGVIFSYGNSESVPYSEQFYVGGANTVRAFTARAIGPGRYVANDAGISYLDQTGDIKFVANLEYRPRLFGNLYGALFLDAGNVWAMKDDGYRGSESMFKWKSIFQDMAIGTGIGIRYDLDFFVIRVDWGIGLHMPYDTGKSGFINVNKFKDCQSLHLAVGYPF